MGRPPLVLDATPHNPHLTLELDPEVPNHETSKWKIKEVFLVLFGLQI